MDFEVLGILAAVGVPTIGGIIATGKLLQMVKDHDRELLELKKEVEQAQDSAMQVQGLGRAIEHLADKMSAEMKHIGEIIAIHHDGFKTQLTDLKEQVQSLRNGSRPTSRRANDQ